ncbi:MULTISPECIES: hypothetical protein [Tsukamurella]|uniref:Uncharacterized protein n=2 Tax=Tsukamurella TaxID=2060 RepID=A0A5C5S446_9ACTN|nr:MULTISPECIES: hypothetical protein [Tsukamurella]NMD55238.1 hypothetical protein [Tsukamurella columbiensis]TWS30256.1 hypothetical protein FK530_07050 [Tsukamurella conjunctivitidis]
MPRRPEFTGRYTDALHALEVSTQRTARVENLGGQYALRVDFELGRYLLATNTDAVIGLADDDAGAPWRVRFFDGALDDGASVQIADRSAAWLIDAYDAAVADLPPLTDVPHS